MADSGILWLWARFSPDVSTSSTAYIAAPPVSLPPKLKHYPASDRCTIGQTSYLMRFIVSSPGGIPQGFPEGSRNNGPLCSERQPGWENSGLGCRNPSAPITPQNRTLCWYAAGTAKYVKTIAKMNTSLTR